MPSLEDSPRAIPATAAFQHRDFRLFQFARSCSIVATEMQALAIAWLVYEITRSPLQLGLIGLTQFLPAVVLMLVVGHAADRFDRRAILIVCHTGLILCATMLFWFARHPGTSVTPVYVITTLIGALRAFSGPASQSLLPEIVPAEHFPNAVAWGSSVFMVATILGPALGGLIYAIGQGAPLAFLVTGVMFASALTAIIFMHVRTGRMERQPTSLETALAGFRYVWQQKLILGSISLDLFAVLLGGAVALLPVYADEILHVGAWGLGLLRGAPAVGAALMGGLLAFHPLRRQAGNIGLVCVAIFGAATIAFGVSRSVWLSLIALFVIGASDMVSVVIRATMVQINTPPEMRGRVAAVNLLFIGASNEFGQFESGVTAHWFGTVPAVVIGGVGTLLVVAIWAWLFPELRKVDRLEAKA